MADHKKKRFLETGSNTFLIHCDKDIVVAREYARDLAGQIGFSSNQRTLIATAVSEICRNIIEYAQNGQIFIETVQKNPKKGIKITVADSGPGITDVEQAMQDGFSTGRGMGVGLPGTKRIMDDFKINSKIGKGTRIIMSKWLL